jgi:16S rRNA (adenine1518-N6/adenine1519-N6)-dimethyltransferase
VAEPLTSRRAVRELLARHQLNADRDFGQNFLVDAHALDAIIEAADPSPADLVLEIGPGLGTLTVALAERAGRVLALEADRRLAPLLAETLTGRANVEVRFLDALTFDYAQVPAGSLLVANLPYNVGTAILVRALTAGTFTRVVVLLQREVAERLTAVPGTAAYGSLSLFAQHHARPRIMRQVGAGSFMPAPKVSSSVVRLDIDPLARPEPDLFAFVRRGFAHRRKTLLKNLELAGFERAAVSAALSSLDLDPRVRAERLDLAAFRALRRALVTA